MADLTEFTPLRIGDCRFDPRSHEIERAGVLVRLPRKQSLLLWALAKAAPEVLTRQSLIDTVWDRRIVEEAVLSRAIAELRRALDDDPREPRYIETIPKSGYRLRASVSLWIEPEPAQPSASATPALDLPTTSAASSTPALRRPGQKAALLALVLLALFWLTRTQFGPPAEQSGSEPGFSVAELSRIRPLTSDPGYEYRADLSADGRWLVYTQSDRDGGPSRLWFQDIDGQHTESLTPAGTHEFRPALSPDGKLVAFQRMGESGCELHIRTISVTSSRKLADCGTPVGSPAWSADQRFLVFTAVAEPEHAAGLSQVNLQTGAIVPLTRPSLAAGPDRDAEWVPKQRALTFARGYDGEQLLLRIDLDALTAEPTMLFDAGRLQGHAWNPDGSQVLVASDAAGYRSLILLAPNGQRLLTLNTRGAQYPVWAGNGELVFELAQYDANIERIELSEGGPTIAPIIASTRYDASPIASPDGSLLAFVSTREDFEHVYVADPNGQNIKRLEFANGARWSRPSFSPDGRFVLATGYDPDNVDWIYRFDRLRAHSERLDELGAHASGARYCPDASCFVYMRRDREGGRSLCQFSTGTGQPPQPIANTDGVEHFEWAGDDLILKRRNQSGFMLLDGPDFVHSESVLSALEPITTSAWTTRQNHVYVVLRDSGSNVLKRADLETGTITTLAEGIDADAVGPSLAVSANGQTIWFARTASMQIDLMRLPARPHR